MLTIVVGAIKHPDAAHQDDIDKGIESGTQYDVKSKSAQDFYKGVKKIYDDCLEKHAHDKDTPDPCCIKKLILDGHSTAGLGGGEGFEKLSAAQIASLKGMLCKGATITNYGCFAFDLKAFPEYKLHLDLAMLLSEKGGSYEGFISATQRLYPNVISSREDEKKTTTVPIPKGATEDDVKKAFKKVDPSGQ